MNKTSTLGVLLPDLYGDFFSEIIRGIDQAARRSEYHLLLSSSHSDRNEVAIALQAMRGRVDGLLILHPDVDGRVLRENLSEKLPVILLSHVGSDSFFAMNIDNFGGAYEAVSHLLKYGHRRIAVITGSAANYDSTERLRGYHQALGDHEVPIDGTLQVEGDFTELSGYLAAQKLLAGGKPPTAIFASNDAMAIGALGALREAGIQVPDDMAVIGFDDIPIATYINPPLSSVHVPIYELGERAIERLIGLIENDSERPPPQELVPTRLIIRESSGQPLAVIIPEQSI